MRVLTLVNSAPGFHFLQPTVDADSCLTSLTVINLRPYGSLAGVLMNSPGLERLTICRPRSTLHFQGCQPLLRLTYLDISKSHVDFEHLLGACDLIRLCPHLTTFRLGLFNEQLVRHIPEALREYSPRLESITFHSFIVSIYIYLRDNRLRGGYRRDPRDLSTGAL